MHVRDWELLVIDHVYPVSKHVESPSAVHTLGNSRCCRHSKDLVTCKYACPFSEQGIVSKKKEMRSDPAFDIAVEDMFWTKRCSSS